MFPRGIGGKDVRLGGVVRTFRRNLVGVTSHLVSAYPASNSSYERPRRRHGGTGT